MPSKYHKLSPGKKSSRLHWLIVDHDQEDAMFTHILFPTDGSELSDKAAARVLELARVHGGRVTAISVVQPFPFMTL
eukprot:gene30485-52623_t